MTLTSSGMLPGSASAGDTLKPLPEAPSLPTMYGVVRRKFARASAACRLSFGRSTAQVWQLNRPRRDKSSRTGGGTERSLRLTRAIGLAHRPLPVRWSSTPWHPRRLWSTESENGGRTEPVYRVEPRLGHRKGERGARTGASDPVLPTILSHGELHICWLDIAV